MVFTLFAENERGMKMYTPGEWVLMRQGKELQGEGGHEIMALIDGLPVTIADIPLEMKSSDYKRTYHVSKTESIKNGYMMAAAAEMYEALKAIPSPSKKFNMGELTRWNKEPENLSVKDIARLVCYLNDTWYVNNLANTALSKAEGR